MIPHMENDPPDIGRTRRPASRHVAVWLTVALLLTALVSGLRYTGFSLSSGPTVRAIDSYPVRRGHLRISVLEGGNLKALKSQEIRAEVEGGTTILSIVAEGTQITAEDVKNGKILIRLDSSDLEDKAISQEIDLNNARASFNQADENLTLQVKQNESDMRTAELNLKFAAMDFEKYLGAALAGEALNQETLAHHLLIDSPKLGGEALQRRRILESDINLAREEVSRARNKLQWTERLHENGYVTGEEREADRLSLNRQQVELERAQTARDLFFRYDFAKETERLLSDYQEARRELERAVTRARSREAQARADLESKRLIYDLQQDKLRKLRRQIDRCTIRATKPGLVVYAGGTSLFQRRQEPIEEGATVRERQLLISLPDLSIVAVDVKVAESSVKKVKPGQKAVVKIDAFPDLILTGSVASVAVVPDSQVSWMNPDLKVYSTEVVIAGEHPDMKPGLTAQVEIIVEELNDVLFVPIRAIHTTAEQPVCYVVKDGYLEARPVVMGSANDSFIHIRQGLEPGETVLLREPQPEEKVRMARDEPDRNQEAA
jgi:multidrug efflux pump subunit AcrA (membrane-fusion protein)